MPETALNHGRTTMQAFRIHAYGGPERGRMEEVERPEPGAGEILVRVHAAALNPVDYKFRQGMLRPIVRPRLPIALGSDLAGTVEAVGAGATKFAVGDRVFARTPELRMGALAQFAAIPEGVAAKMPANASFDQAAAIPLAALTALQALRDVLGVQRGWRLLITGGTGGVGTFAIQIARHLGAEVATTASSRGADLARRLGADQVIDYEKERFEDRLSELDGVFDLIGGATLRRCFRVVRKGATVVSVGGVPEPNTAKDLDGGAAMAAMFAAISVRERFAAWRNGARYRYYFMHSSGSDLEELAAMMEAGTLEPVIDRTFPFAGTAEAFAYLEEGHAKGKVVVTMDEPT
ncbi:MAG TPA: NADP-dependent oxidoreductase [Pirellulaceae bacterium]|nr:NADP-dependent oxidoreductase [Pirellulaceae bacterium]